MKAIFFYLVLCFLWTILRYMSNKGKNITPLKMIMNVLFNFFLYPVSFIYHTYSDIFKMYYIGNEE